MDVIKYTGKSKCLGKHKCSCGLVVKLYEEDLNSSNQWTCPGCDSHNYPNDTSCFPIKVVVAVILCIFLFIASIIVTVLIHNCKMNHNYAYKFETCQEGDVAWHTYYTNEDVRALSSLPAGFEYHDWYNDIYYAKEGQPIRKVRKT